MINQKADKIANICPMLVKKKTLLSWSQNKPVNLQNTIRCFKTSAMLMVTIDNDQRQKLKIAVSLKLYQWIENFVQQL